MDQEAPMTTTAIALRGRSKVRQLKRQLRTAGLPSAAAAQQDLGRDSVLELLERSMRFGHQRLALQRLHQALKLGAVLTETHWKYCHGVAARSQDKSLQERYLALALEHSVHPPGAH